MPKQITDQLKQVLENKQGEYLEILKELIACDTQVLGHGIAGGKEINGQQYLEKLFERMGADSVERDQMDEALLEEAYQRYHEGNLGHVQTDRFNLYAKFKGKQNKSLLFNGHIDTMPPGELELWRSNPWQAEVRDGRIYGLGAADMKGGLLASILAVKLLQDAGIELPIDVKYAVVVDEEGGGNGSIQAALNGQKAEGVIVCEPTNRELIVANMAFVFFKVEVEGKSCHSGAKWEGVSAIEKAMLLMQEIKELEHEWLLRYRHPLLPSPSQNFGVITGGTAGSSIPDYCCFQTCVHYLPSMSRDEVIKEYQERILERAKADPWLRDHLPKIEIYQEGGGFEIDANEPLPRAMREAWQRAIGQEMPVVASPCGCDCRSWAKIASCPVIQCGPGELKDCHTPNESLEIAQFFEYILAYAELILCW